MSSKHLSLFLVQNPDSMFTTKNPNSYYENEIKHAYISSSGYLLMCNYGLD
jgi:hypothetical protein